MLLTDKYADKIYGMIACYDRMIIQGYFPGWSHAESMTGCLNESPFDYFKKENLEKPVKSRLSRH